MENKVVDNRTAFKDKINELLALHPNQWTGADSAAVVRVLLGNLKDAQGNLIELTPEELDVVELASRPTNEVQMRVIRTIAARHNAALDTTTDALVKKVVSPTSFKIELAKAGKIQDTNSGGLKDLLD